MGKRFCHKRGAPRFLCDVHLGKVAKYLRVLGFDTLYRDDFSDEEILSLTRCGRIALTCDRHLWKRAPERIVLLRHEEAPRQMKRIVALFSLGRWAQPFRRSLCCNRPMSALDKEEAWRIGVPVKSYRWVAGYWQCPKCRKLFWQGTHACRMRKRVLDFLDVSEKNDEKNRRR